MERAIETHQQARTEYTRSVAGAFIQDDPDRAIDRVFTGANRQQKASLLMDLTRGNTAAKEGLQRGAIDFIRSRFEGAPLPGSDAGAMMPKRFADFELIPPAGDKVSRLNACVPVFENGIIYAPDTEWSDMVIRQVSHFPRGDT